MSSSFTVIVIVVCSTIHAHSALGQRAQVRGDTADDHQQQSARGELVLTS